MHCGAMVRERAARPTLSLQAFTHAWSLGFASTIVALGLPDLRGQLSPRLVAI